jgi:muramoyltetrapeptide carboxypeptidase
LRGRILAVEDIDEKPYQVDRDLFQLARAGCLNGIVGLIFGRFPAPQATGYAGPSTATIAGQWAARLGVPAVFGLPIGHDPDPVTLAIDRPSTLSVTTSGWTFSQHPDPG